MLVKSLLQPLESLHDAPIRGVGVGGGVGPLVGCSTTPHCIKLSLSADEEEHQSHRRKAGCKQRRIDLSPTTLGSRLQPSAADEKFTKVLEVKTAARKPSQQHKLTEFFPVRRSVRKCKHVVLQEKQRDLENKLLCGVEEGLEVRHFPGKGRGVVTTRAFTRGEYVVEYAGELIDMTTARKREAKYSKDQNAGCYMYYFQYRNQQYCIDATAESSRLGRLVNHSRNGNLTTRIVSVGSVPHLALVAKHDIPAGQEVSYDYGDRSRESIRNHPWLAL